MLALTVAACTVSDSHIDYCMSSALIVHFTAMFCFSPRLTSRYFSWTVVIVTLAMMVRAWIPLGYMPAQHSPYPHLTFCHVGLNAAQQSLLGLLEADEQHHYLDTSQHCLFSAQAQSGWLKTSGGALFGPALLPVFRLAWLPAFQFQTIPTVYSSLWARAPPVVRVLS